MAEYAVLADQRRILDELKENGFDFEGYLDALKESTETTHSILEKAQQVLKGGQLAGLPEEVTKGLEEGGETLESASGTLEAVNSRLGQIQQVYNVGMALKNAGNSDSDAVAAAAALLDAGSNYLPPGINSIVSFYAQAVKAIAGKLKDIEESPTLADETLTAYESGQIAPHSDAPLAPKWAYNHLRADDDDYTADWLKDEVTAACGVWY